MHRLRLAQAARDDILGIGIYSKNEFGAQIALEYINGLRGAFSFLRDRPLAGSAEDDLGKGMRSFAHRSHRLYYRVDGDEVIVIRILHHARDARAVLNTLQ